MEAKPMRALRHTSGDSMMSSDPIDHANQNNNAGKVKDLVHPKFHARRQKGQAAINRLTQLVELDIMETH